MTLEIRRASADDKPEWLRMRLLLWPDVESPELLVEMDRMLADPMTPVFVIQRPGGGLAGFIETGTRKYADGCVTAPVGYIEGWFVDADVRRRGIGRLLITAAEDWARSLGLHEMASDTGLSNHDGLNAHLALGYREYERAIHFVKTL